MSPLILLVFLLFLGARVEAESPFLQIHVIPHSHCDPGWLTTFEDYYNTRVQRILTNVLHHLSVDASKKFVWAEISFFSLWYDKLSIVDREKVQRIVKNGQLEFVEGGWVQADEAGTNLDDLISQVSEGHAYLEKNFGVRPTIAWQIDPFGHSSLSPTVYARLGFSALVINRIHFALKSSFKGSGDMEFVWRPSASLPDVELMTHVLHTHYSAPVGFDWEENGYPINSGTVEGQAQRFAESMRNWMQGYQSDRCLVTWGDDFKFQNADIQFSNMDQLITHINANPDRYRMHVQYSTVAEYFRGLSKWADLKQHRFPLYRGDFFPYADNSDSYWTGYYTSRPLLKRLIRLTSSLIRAGEVSHLLARGSSGVDWRAAEKELMLARRALALAQHHDGVTGTAKSWVVSDYMQKLDAGAATTAALLEQCAGLLLAGKERPVLQLSNHIDTAKPGPWAVVLQNPLAWTSQVPVVVRLTGPTRAFGLYDESGRAIPSQLNPVYSQITGTGAEEAAVAAYDLHFLADLPPLALVTYFVRAEPHASSAVGRARLYYNGVSGLEGRERDGKYVLKDELAVQNHHYQLRLSTRGLLASVTVNGKRLAVQERLLAYDTQRSGAYLFRSVGAAREVSGGPVAVVVVLDGPLVTEVQTHHMQGAAPTYEKVLRLYTTTPDNPWGQVLLASHDLRATVNSETIVRYETGVASGDTYYTDNTVEMLARRRRSQVIAHENYYPCPTSCFIRDDEQQVTVLTSRAVGSASLAPGHIEIMGQRSLGQDDGRGLGEAMRDDAAVPTPLWLMVGPGPATERIRRQMSLHQHHPVLVFTGPGAGWAERHQSSHLPLAHSLPANVHLLSLRARDGVSDSAEVRLMHTFELGQDELLSQPAAVDLAKLFTERLPVAGVAEYTLDMMTDRQDYQPLPFKAGDQVIRLTPDLVAQDVNLERQNGQEEGVFLSKEALAELARQKKAKEEQERKASQKARRLLAYESFEPSTEVLVDLAPLHIRAFVFQLHLPALPAEEPGPAQQGGQAFEGQGVGFQAQGFQGQAQKFQGLAQEPDPVLPPGKLPPNPVNGRPNLDPVKLPDDINPLHNPVNPANPANPNPANPASPNNNVKQPANNPANPGNNPADPGKPNPGPVNEAEQGRERAAEVGAVPPVLLGAVLAGLLYASRSYWRASWLCLYFNSRRRVSLDKDV